MKIRVLLSVISLVPYLAFAQAHGYQIIDYGMDGEEKLFMVRDMPIIEKTKEQIAKSRIKELKKLLKEVDKCDLLCANCHAEKHYKED